MCVCVCVRVSVSVRAHVTRASRLTLARTCFSNDTVQLNSDKIVTRIKNRFGTSCFEMIRQNDRLSNCRYFVQSIGLWLPLHVADMEACAREIQSPAVDSVCSFTLGNQERKLRFFVSFAEN